MRYARALLPTLEEAPADATSTSHDVARRGAVRNASNARLAGILFDNWNMGWPVKALAEYPHELASIDVGQLSAALATCRATSVIAVVAP